MSQQNWIPKLPPAEVPKGALVIMAGQVPCAYCDSVFTMTLGQATAAALIVTTAVDKRMNQRGAILRTRCLDCLQSFTPEEADRVLKARITKDAAQDKGKTNGQPA